jgi:hypothetical protein
MASEGGSGFGWGLVIGGMLGVAVGAYLASGPGREQVDSLRQQTIELTGPDSELRKAVQEGISAARKRRTELETEVAAGMEPAPRTPPAPKTPPEPQTPPAATES